MFLPIFFGIDFLNTVQNTVQDLKITDMVFSQIRDQKNEQKDTNIVIVNIGYLNRAQVAEQLNIINSYSPKVIGIDVMYFSEKTPEMDLPLADALSKIKNLVMVGKLESKSDTSETFDDLLLPAEKFRQNAKIGYANFILAPEEFQTIRAFSPKEKYKNTLQLAFSLQIAKIFNSKAVEDFLNRDNETEIINFRRNIDKYTILDVDDVFLKKDSLQFIKDKIVLFGFLGKTVNTKMNEDIFYTPMNPQYLGKAYPDMYGIVVHANAITMILHKDQINALPDILRLSIIGLLAYFIMALFSFMRIKLGEWYESLSLLVLLIVMAFVLFVILYSFYRFNYLMEIKEVFLVFMIAEMVSESYHGSIKPLSIEGFKKVKNKYFRKKISGDEIQTPKILE